MNFHFQPSSVDFDGSVAGSHSGLMVGGFQRVDELNDRISSRIASDHVLPVQFDFRPVATKYSIFPMIDRRAKPTVPLPKSSCPNGVYDVKTTFAPMQRRGPTQYGLDNVDTETVLQNRHVVYQRHADQGVYVPHSNSDLYRVEAVGRQEEQTHPALFLKDQYSTSGSNIASLVGRELFHNNTRTQLRGLSSI